MKYKNIFIGILFLFVIQLVPVTVTGAIGIPCATSDESKLNQRIAEYKRIHPTASEDEARRQAGMCSFNDIFVLINNAIKFFLRTILLPLMVIMIAYSGWLFMTSGSNPEKRTQAKNIFKKMGIGLALILFAWSIVYLIFTAFGVDTTRGRAGLSDNKINWAPSSTTAQSNNTGNTNTANNNSNLSNLPRNSSAYQASIVANVANPDSSRITITISPRAGYRMAIRVNCAAEDGDTIVSGEGTIASGSNIVTITLKLMEDTNYLCSVENNDGLMDLIDETDANIKTPRISPVSSGFRISSTRFLNNEIIINYQNTENIQINVGDLSCVDTINGSNILGQTGGMLDLSRGDNIRTLNYSLPPGFSQTLKNNITAKCTFTVYEKNPSNIKAPKRLDSSFNLNIPANPNLNTPNTVFRIDEINARENSVVIVFNGSVNIDPRMNLVCSSLGANHIFRARVSFDPTNTLPIGGTDNNLVSPGTTKSPISIPVVWNGYGLRPGVGYNCTLTGQTLEKVSGFPDQRIIPLADSAYVPTPLIPLIKRPESKLDYRVSLRQPRIMYVNYPILRSIDPLSNGPYIAQSVFRQAVPDSIFVPVVNGEVVDNSRMNVSCTNILGPAMGTSWIRTVSVSGSSESTNGMSQVYGDNTTGVSYGPGFAIPITRDARSGFMHSSAYVCLAGFTVERVPQIRQFFVTVPINVDPTEIGPIVLAAENVGVNNGYAYFTVVASPRVENNVNYSCRNVNGNYSGQVFWPPHSWGTRMPVTIPISTTIPGLKPGLTYNCNLEGTTFQKEQLNYQFIIRTP